MPSLTDRQDVRQEGPNGEDATRGKGRSSFALDSLALNPLVESAHPSGHAGLEGGPTRVADFPVGTEQSNLVRWHASLSGEVMAF